MLDGRVIVQYRVKWRGYPKVESTWEPRSILEPRNSSLLDAFDRGADPPPRKITPPPKRRSKLAPVPPPLPPPPPNTPPSPPRDDSLPLEAKHIKGTWYYRMILPGAVGLHGPRTRWFPSTHFSESELIRFSENISESLPRHTSVAGGDHHQSLVGITAASVRFSRTMVRRPIHARLSRHQKHQTEPPPLRY
jgi:hypothetical protein